jgi:hypothetical protein
VRIYTKDPDNILRMGMPATARLLAAASPTTRVGLP